MTMTDIIIRLTDSARENPSDCVLVKIDGLATFKDSTGAGDCDATQFETLADAEAALNQWAESLDAEDNLSDLRESGMITFENLDTPHHH
tara:strand:- start:208 stop:477 length:270 start_codon:yes stop_codon:yes gene_type:complete